MSIQEPVNPPATGEPPGGVESRGQARASQPAVLASLAFDYMDEEIEEAMLAGEPLAPAPWIAIDPPDPAGLD